MTVRFCYPRVPKYSRFLYYFSVYVNLSKNSFLFASEEVFLVSGCKGTTFFWTTKTFAGKISQNMHFFYWSWFMSNHTPILLLIIIYARARTLRKRQTCLTIGLPEAFSCKKAASRFEESEFWNWKGGLLRRWRRIFEMQKRNTWGAKVQPFVPFQGLEWTIAGSRNVDSRL